MIFFLSLNYIVWNIDVRKKGELMYIRGCASEWIITSSLKWNQKQKGVDEKKKK